MSRCFPFPPPGYETKTTTGSVEASKKEESKERKGKKEKRDKEKREGKDKKHKDRSKGKHGEKKEGKEKDRKKKDKDKGKKKEKDKDRISNEKTLEEQTRNHHGESCHTTGPGKNIKFSKLSDSRIGQDGTGKQTAGNSVCKPISKHVDTNKMAEKGIEMDVKMDRNLAVHEKKSGAMGNVLVEGIIGNDNMVNNFITGDQRSHVDTSRKIERGRGMDTKIDKKITANDERRIGAVGTINNNVANKFSNAEHRRHVNTNRKLFAGEKRFGAIGNNQDEEGVIDSNMVNDSITAEQRQQVGTSRIAENGRDADTKMDRILAASNEKRFGAMGNLLVEGNVSKNMIDKFVGAEQEGFGGFGVLPKKDTDKRIGEKEKSKDKGTDVQKKERHKGKKKDRDRDKRKEKKKEKHKTKEKKEHKDQKHIAEAAKIVVVPSMKSSLPPQDIEMCDANVKRKQNNGFLLEDDVRPNKLRRMASFSHLPVENGRKPNIHHVAVPPSMSDLHGGENNVVLERIADNKEPTTNGVVNSQLPEIVATKTNPPTDVNKASEVSKKPHRDEKYLSQILSVPKMEEWLEVDGQEWLFGGDDLRQIPKLKLTNVETPEVWSKALRIEEADVLALPYVIPY